MNTEKETAAEVILSHSAEAARRLWELSEREDVKDETKLKLLTWFAEMAVGKAGSLTKEESSAPVIVRFEGVLEDWSG